MAIAQKASTGRVSTSLYEAKAQIGAATRAAVVSGTHHQASRPPVRRPRRWASATDGSTKTRVSSTAITATIRPRESREPARAVWSTGVSGGGCVSTYRKITTTVRATSRQPTSTETNSIRPYDRFSGVSGFSCTVNPLVARRNERVRPAGGARGSILPAGLNVFNSFLSSSQSQVSNVRMYQVFTSWVSVQYASSTPISHGK